MLYCNVCYIHFEVLDAAVVNLNVVSDEDFVDQWYVAEIKENSTYICFDVFVIWCVKPNYVACFYSYADGWHSY